MPVAANSTMNNANAIRTTLRRSFLPGNEMGIKEKQTFCHIKFYDPFLLIESWAVRHRSYVSMYLLLRRRLEVF